jgi:hypothetical protein
MLKGIDVSSNDGWSGGKFGRSNTESAYAGSDFVIVKLTQGTGYVNPPYAKMLARAEKDGKLIGCYHYADGGSAVAEARFFVKHAQPYLGRALLVLDFESIQNRAWGDYGWCRRFVDEVHRLTGVWCAIYIQASSRGKAASCADVCPLWLAGYPDYRNSWQIPTFRYGTSPWETWTLWQYTSGGGTDRDVAQLDRDGWLRIAGSAEQTSGGEKKQEATEEEEDGMGVIVEPRNNGKPEGYQAYVVDGKIVILTKPEQAAALAAIGVKTKIVTSEQMEALKQVMPVTSAAKSDAAKK